MLYELKNITQPEGQPKRRWFTDEIFDLIVWYNNNNEIIGFQLCYNKDINEQSFIWKQPSRYFLHKVDDGEENTGSKSIPTLTSNTSIDLISLKNQFTENSKNIDRNISVLVLQKINDFLVKQSNNL